MVALAQQIHLREIPAHLKREYEMASMRNQLWIRPKERQTVLKIYMLNGQENIRYYLLWGALSTRYWWLSMIRYFMEILDKFQTRQRFLIDKALWLAKSIHVIHEIRISMVTRYAI